jgi:hypothetical protein
MKAIKLAAARKNDQKNVLPEPTLLTTYRIVQKTTGKQY